MDKLSDPFFVATRGDTGAPPASSRCSQISRKFAPRRDVG